MENHRQHLIRIIREQRIDRQRGVIVNFNTAQYDPDTEFIKTGNGSLGGKARGLAFFSSVLHRTASNRLELVSRLRGPDLERELDMRSRLATGGAEA